MKTVWKWILGILLGLVALALLVGVPYLIHATYQVELDGVRAGSGRPMHDIGAMPMLCGMDGFGLYAVGGIVTGLIQLGVLVLIVLGIIWLIRALRSSGISRKSCKKCGNPVQTDWKSCPYCGKAL